MVITKLTPKKLLSIPLNDHRNIGLRQRLFFFNDLSQGSCFFEPRGAHIYNKLIGYLRKEYQKRNYAEVITPNIYNCKLWQTSGHWNHYEKNMIKFQVGEREFSLKPMNCPGHCLMFKHQGLKTSDQLPVRWADFGVLHRNELSGSLIGLTRVRRFQQDDAHIFCTPQQVESEVSGCLQFASQVYGLFGFEFGVKLSLRPKEFLGDADSWDKAEESLRKALEKSGIEWEEDKFEGAFYGPKIDLVVKDCQERSHQCATIQLDFQLPERFELLYKDVNDKGLHRPVIIHRALFGSLERFIAMIAENCEGRWPFWLSPLQAQVIPVHHSLNSYAKEVSDEFRHSGFWVDCDLRNETFNAKIREATTTPYNIVLIVGQKEKEKRCVTGRVSEKSVQNIEVPIQRLKDKFREFEEQKVNRADLELLKLSE